MDKLVISPEHPVDSNDDAMEVGGSAIGEVFNSLLAEWRLIIGGAMLVGVMALGLAFLLPPTYTARATFLPPQQQQGSAAAALSSLGALAGLTGGAAGIKTTADQYLALMQSITISNRIIDRYKLMDVYDRKFRVDAQVDLANHVRMAVGKKDGIITIEVDDNNQERSAAIANGYIEALRTLTTTLAVTEAQQRRVFFEQQLQATKQRLTQAQIALQSTGINASAIKTEPKAAAEGYAKLRAELTAGEVKLQTLRSILVDNTPEIVQQRGMVEALKLQVAKLEASNPKQTGDIDYIGRYREFKYQEALFDLFARQYELARVDESREGALIQVLDAATPPERKSKPKRGMIAVSSSVLAGVVLSLLTLTRFRWRRHTNTPH